MPKKPKNPPQAETPAIPEEKVWETELPLFPKTPSGPAAESRAVLLLESESLPGPSKAKATAKVKAKPKAVPKPKPKAKPKKPKKPTLKGVGAKKAVDVPPSSPVKPPKAPRKRTKPTPKPVEEAPPAAPEPIYEYSGARKTTVSFYAAEHDQVDRILDLLIKARRHRGGFSDAIKIALRLCPLDAKVIGEAWDAARAADKRTSQGRVNKA